MHLDNKIKKKLYVYQVEHTENLINILKKNTTVLDSSQTGTGKTACAVAVCAQLKLNPIIICPKSIMHNWATMCEMFHVKPVLIVNYESIKYGKFYVNGDRKKCPYINVKTKKLDNGEEETVYEWNSTLLDDKTVFIFDEVHKCSDVATLNGKLLYYAKNLHRHMMLLSATIADHPESFHLFFYILNFIDPNHVKEKGISFRKYMNVMHNWVMRDPKPMYKIYTMLYPDRASRMRIDTLGDLFPETQITAIPYNMGKKREKEIESQYRSIAEELNILNEKKEKDKKKKGGINVLTLLLRAHQRIELIKVPTFVELTNDYIYNGHSVVIFVNFTQTLKQLAKLLETTCVVYGEQTYEDRMKNIKKFMDNKSKVIICNMKAGSVGLSLHDVNGGHPRVSLISPTWSSIDLVQALGRIHRVGGKTKSLQRIIYAANTIEEKIADKVQIKLKNINDINNGDLDLTNIVFKKEHAKNTKDILESE